MPAATMYDSPERPRLLLLCHRIPYPPDKGDKIRSWRWLQALAGPYRVTLAAFVDDPDDDRHQALLSGFCERLLLLPLRPRIARWRSLPALLNGAPLSVRYYQDRRLAAWLRAEHARERFSHVLVYSSAMAQYVRGTDWAATRRVIDFVDVDADKWAQYAAGRRGPLAWVYRRESRRLLAHDLTVARQFDLSLFVSAAEAALFAGYAGAGPGTGTGIGAEIAVEAVNNGVDGAFFAPAAARASPYTPNRPAVVFTGAMDYWANVDAVTWFVREVWPQVLAQVPSAVFFIVGSRPATPVAALAGASVVVTGRVADVRPYLQHAAVVVAPMRIARGIQNKVLEGMAMGRPLVVTSQALEGIAARAGEHVLLADTAPAFAAAVGEVLSQRQLAVGLAARQLVLERYTWPRQLERLLALVGGNASGQDTNGRDRIPAPAPTTTTHIAVPSRGERRRCGGADMRETDHQARGPSTSWRFQ